MRVPNATIYQNVETQLGRLTQRLNQANRQMSTQKKLNALSDDPAALMQVLSIRSAVSSMEQLDENIAFGSSWLKAAQSALDNAQDILSEARSIAVQMGSDTFGADERQANALRIAEMTEELTALANANVNGRHVFAGNDTTTPPFVKAGDTATYEGSATEFSVRVGQSTTVVVGANGQEVFGGVFDHMADLKSALENNDGAGIRQALGDLVADWDHLNAKVAENGGRAARLETRQNIMNDVIMTETARRSSLEDVDFTRAVVELKTAEMAYQAALSSSAKVLETSLMDFL